MSFARCALVGLVAVAVAGCEPGHPEAAEQAAARGTSPLEAGFERVAREYQVPVELLKAIAHVETRVRHHGPQPSMTFGHGLMNLVAREDWPALQQGAELTGEDPGRLKLDEEANLRAAAAFLRKLAEKSFAEHADLNPHDPADFWHAVSLYPGFEGHGDAQAYAAEVYRTVERGFEVERPDGTVVVAPTQWDWRRHQPLAQRKDAAKEYPAAYQWQASPNYSSTGRTSYEFVVVHTVQGSYAGCISWFKNTASNVSAHYVVRSSDGQITQMVEHRHVAWHASCYNARSIGIEHEGYAQDPTKWYTNAMYTESGKLTRWIADRHGIPKTRSRIIGHVEIPSACNKNAHWDPGTGWNWTKYMGVINGTTTTPTNGTLKGVIYHSGSTANVVSGATVTAAGQTKTTGTDGTYTFSLAPGTYTVNVAKSGYTSNSVSRTVTAGATIWGSMEINAVSLKGKLAGVIYQGGSTANRVSGAVVTTAGKTLTTGADGAYEFELDPGSYTVNVTKSGYSSNQVSRTVVASTTVWGSMEINPLQTAGKLTGAIYQNGNTADRVAGALVKVSGTTASMTTGTDGLYTFDLPPGTYTATASKTGYVNASVTRTVSSGATIWGSMELKPGTPPVVVDTVPPQVAITFPGDGAVMDYAVLELSGQASDDKGPVAKVRVRINDGAASEVAVLAAAFSRQIKLSPGKNVIEVSATDAAGNSSVDIVKVTFRAGVSGFLHLVDDEAARVAGAKVMLVDSLSGEELPAVQSGPDGSFELDLLEVNRDLMLVVSADGFMTRAETLSIPDDERLFLALPMVEGEDPVAGELALEFIEPLDGAVIQRADVTVYGTVGGFQVTSVKVNGEPAELVGAGGFAATVSLELGQNVILAEATGAGGQTLSGSIQVIREAPPALPPQGGTDPDKTEVPARGCAGVPGLQWLALLGVLPLVRRRRG